MRIALPTSLLAAALALGTAAFAQDAPPPPPQQAPATAPAPHPHNPARELKRMTSTLALTPDEVSKIQPILADRDQKLDAITPDPSHPKAEHQQRHAINENASTQINAILTPAQQQQFAAMHAPKGQRGQATQPPPPTA